MPRSTDDNDTEYDRDADRLGEPDDVACVHCGQDGLYWQDTYDAKGTRKPRLYEDGKPHACKPSTDDFEVLK